MKAIVQLIISQVPSIIDLIRTAHAEANPGAPALTSDEIIAAAEEAFLSTVAKDEMLKVALQAEIDAQG